MNKLWRGRGPRRRGLCLLLALVCCFSASMAGTLALHSDGSTAANRFFSGTGGGGTVQVAVNKVWSGGSARPEVRAQLYQNGAAYGPPAPLNGGNGWTHTWTGLPEGYTYSVDEVDVPSGYTKAVTKNSDASFTITNTYNGGGGGGVDYTKVSAEKVWAGESDPNRPKSVEVQLSRGGKALGNPVVLSADNGWKHTWSRLDDSYTYSVDEVNVPEGYTKTLTRKGNAWTITNTYDKSAVKPGLTDVTVTKAWAGDGPHPEGVVVALYLDGVQRESVTLNAANQWTYIWRDLSKDSAWTVDEPAVPAGYVKTIAAGSTANSFVITNTKAGGTSGDVGGDTPGGDVGGDTPGGGGALVVVSGTKVWRHGSNPESAWPGQVTISVLNGGTAVKTLAVTQANGWKYSVTLPKYDKGGAEIRYHVSEKVVPGYRAVILGYNITNIHESAGSGGPQTGDDNAVMLWFALMLGSAVAIKLLLGNVTLQKKRR